MKLMDTVAFVHRVAVVQDARKVLCDIVAGCTACRCHCMLMAWQLYVRGAIVILKASIKYLVTEFRNLSVFQTFFSF